MAAPGLTGGLIAVGAVVVVALILRATTGSRKDEEGSVPTFPTPAPEPVPQSRAAERTAPADGDEDGDGADDGLVVAVSADGRAFVPDLHTVRLMQPPEEGEAWKVGTRLQPAQAMAPASGVW